MQCSPEGKILKTFRVIVYKVIKFNAATKTHSGLAKWFYHSYQINRLTLLRC